MSALWSLKTPGVDQGRLFKPAAWFIMALLALSLSASHAASNKSSAPAKAATDVARPNFLFLVADDLGFADISRLGSEITTPNIDRIANEGILFTRFYTAATCSPTRAMLLTGVDHHRTGLGNIADLLTDRQRGQPGYEGFLNRRVLTIPELLEPAGYHSYMAGKWHLGMEAEQTPDARGFERSFALMDGGASHFADMVGATTFHPHASYREDGEIVSELPADFYSTRFYTNKLIEYIDSNLSDERPFFAYAAYTAPHWPLQVPDDIRDLYAGEYDAGYDVLRKQRFDRIKALGLIPAQAKYPARANFVQPWEELSKNDRKVAARQMEIYAAMVAELDANIGRLIDFLRSRDQLQRTVIVFLSDNGADSFTLERAPAHIAQHARRFDNSLENVGRKNSFTMTGAKWAGVSEAPFRLYKMMPSEGGVRSPAAIWYPAISGPSNVVNEGVTSVMDLTPTILELAQLEHPAASDNDGIYAPDGRSLVGVISGSDAAVREEHDTLGIEVWGRRAIIKGRWKAMRIPASAASDKWELFDLDTDPGEQSDLAAQMPEKLAELIADWDRYETQMGIILP